MEIPTALCYNKEDYVNKEEAGLALKIIFYIFYGLICGLTEFMPVSTAAHSFLLEELTNYQTRHPLTLLLIHFACLLVVLIQCRHRISHMRRELHLQWQKPKIRKRQPDRMTVLDGKIAIMAALPTVLMLAFSDYTYQAFTNTLSLSILLIVSGILIYLPQFQPGANRISPHITPLEALSMGLFGGFGVMPGLSRMGCFISLGMLRGWDRKYVLDIAFLVSVPALAILIILDLVSLIVIGLGTISMGMFLYSTLAGITAFAGAWLAIVIMRYLCSGANYSGFAYYNWGLGLFAFILYLMV